MSRRLARLAWALAVTVVARADEPRVTALVEQHVHPVLIRNESDDLIDLIVTAPSGGKDRLLEVVFRLDETDDLADLESLVLIPPVGPPSTPISPASRVGFKGNWPLKAAKNTFRLACRLKPTANLDHHVAATCETIETSAGRIVPKNPRPTLRRPIGLALRKHNDDGVHTFRIPALTTTPTGTLLCVYDMRRNQGRDLQEDIDIGLSRSTDGGRSWAPTRVIMDMGEFNGLPQSQNGCSDPGIIVDRRTGTIFCFAVWMNGKPGKHQWTADGSEPGYEIGKSAQFLMVKSNDDGLTWSKPENLTRALKKAEWWLLAPSPQSGINLPDGTLVMPIQGRDKEGKEFSTIMTSRDHGSTWNVGVPAYSGGSECQAALLGDGSIMLNMRNERAKARAVRVTSDLGRTWRSHPTDQTGLIEPRCNASLIRIDLPSGRQPDHVLLFSNPRTQTTRTNQTIQVSFDDGLTWPNAHHRLLDEGRGAGYSSLTRIDRDHVGIVYEGSRAHVVFQRIPIAELLRPNP